MSSDPSDKIRLKCNVDGAGDYFIEPIQSDDIESIWRHTPPQREEKNINISSSPIPYLQAEENNRNPESLATINSGHFLPEIQRSIDDEVNKHLNGLTVSCSNSKVSKKRKEAEPQPPHDGSEAPEQYTTAKKQRLIWTQDLHSIFTTAVKNLTVEKAVPKKILEYMRGQGVIELTRENVASHLQKYRLFLRRKENDEKLSNLNSQSVSLNGSKQSNFRRSSPSDQISHHIENNSNCCSNPHFPLQNFSEHERSHIISNHAIDNVVPSLDQNRFFDQNMPHHSLHLTTQQPQRLPPPAQDRNCYVHHGGTVSSFQAMPSSFAPSTTPNMVPFSEIQRNDVLTMQNLQLKSEPMAQPLNGDDLLFEDISHPQFLSDHYFNVYGNGGLAPVKINSGGISVLCNDFFQGHHTNFIEDYENQQFDRFVNTPESNFSSAFYYDHPTMSNSTLEMEMEMEFEQNRRTNFNPSNNNPPDNASM